MEFADFVKMAARNVLIVLVLLMVGAGVGWGLASRETPSYQAEASVLFSLQTTESGVGAGNQDLMDRMPTYAELALTSRVLDDVVKSTGYPGGVEVLRNSLEAVAPEGKFLVELRLNDTDRNQVRADTQRSHRELRARGVGVGAGRRRAGPPAGVVRRRARDEAGWAVQRVAHRVLRRWRSGRWGGSRYRRRDAALGNAPPDQQA